MAWGEKRGPNRWRGAYRVKMGGELVERYLTEDPDTGLPFTSAAKAKRAAGAKEDEMRHRPAARLRKGMPTIGEFCKADYWPNRKVQLGTKKRDESPRDLHVLPQWENIRLDVPIRQDVEEWVEALLATRAVRLTAGGHRQEQRTLKPGTVRRIFFVYSGIMRAAFDAGLITSTPCYGVTLPTASPSDEYFLKEDEYKRLYDAAPNEDMELFLELGVGTGGRYGELTGLHRRRIDTKNKSIVFHETWDHVGQRMKAYPKGGNRRGVPISGDLAERLEDYMKRHPPVKCTTPHIDDQGNIAECRSALLFTWNDDGDPWPYSSVRHQLWVPLLAAAELPGVRIHDMRHTYASWLIQRRISKDELCELMGHSSTIVTQRYAHLAGTHWDRVRTALGDRPAPTPDPTTASGPVIDSEKIIAESAPEVLPTAADDAGALIIPFRRSRRSAS
jgi:integrase